MKLYEKILDSIVIYERKSENKKFLSGEDIIKLFPSAKDKDKLIDSLAYLQDKEFITITGYLDYALSIGIESTPRGKSYRVNKNVEYKQTRHHLFYSTLISIIINLLTRPESATFWVNIFHKYISILLGYSP